MTKFGTIDFDDKVLDALSNDSLVIFAGAGVSMGPPSNLPSFKKLVYTIAQSTGYEPSKPYDRFLGELSHQEIAVHILAAKILSPNDSTPCELHYNLLRLFQSVERVRLITTNFDLHFETAAQELFTILPEIYQAPALPRGYDFSGIVHIHGALPYSNDLVLTDADFGRAYLTEGWARRFLVDVFRRYTVLFIGYSHDDVVMNYLSRAIPVENIAGRFALTDNDEKWNLLGIQPIRFTNDTHGQPFKELYNGVNQLAERTTRGALDWQSRLAELGVRLPPIDDNSISEVEHALRQVHTTRLLLNVAHDPTWLRWLNDRKYLDGLFDTKDLSEQDMVFASWLVQHFVFQHQEIMTEIIVGHGLRLNPNLWYSIGRELGVMEEKALEVPALKRWIAILLSCLPSNPDHLILMLIAEQCARHGCIDMTLKLFLIMSSHRLKVKPDYFWSFNEVGDQFRLEIECPLLADHWALNEVWVKYLRPQIEQIAQPLLSGVTRRIEEIYCDFEVWGKASPEWDPVSYGRSAIEPHEQDKYPEAIDSIIDVARDTLEWLAVNSPNSFSTWIDGLISSNVPLLRRLAIHGINFHPDYSHDNRLIWLIDRCDFNRTAEHHEVHHVVELSYPFASEQARKAMVDNILAIWLPSTDSKTSELRSARKQFEWLSWLVLAKPDCAVANQPLLAIKAEYPEWQLSDHPDLTHWTGSMGWVGSVSPWSVEQLLAMDLNEQIEDLLNFDGKVFDGPSREGLLSTCHEACRQNSKWAFSLGKTLTERQLWQSDLWPELIRGLQESKLTPHGWNELLLFVSHKELQIAHPYVIAKLLFAMVNEVDEIPPENLMEQANAIALSLWDNLGNNNQIDSFRNWLHYAINRPAGIIVQFWLKGLSQVIENKWVEHSGGMPDNYLALLTMVVDDETIKGGLGRSVLASHTAILFDIDETWTKQHIIPLYSDQNPQKFAQAWDGFLIWGRLNPALVDELLPAFIEAMQRLNTDLTDSRRRFIEFYTTLATFYVPDPTQSLLQALLRYGSDDDRLIFTTHLGYFIRKMHEPAKRKLWESWVSSYLQDRINGTLKQFDQSEIQQILNWLPQLGDDFPKAVELVTKLQPIRIDYTGLLSELQESDLVTRYPTDTAELLIYLANCEIKYHLNDLVKIKARLSEIPENVNKRLAEAFARAGMS